MEYHVRRALKTTQAMLADALRTGEGSFSLCHGLAGNADVVMLSSDFLGDEVVSESVSPPTVGVAGIERAQSSRLFGPGSGVEAPGLMHGMAGIGYFYLRLCRQNIPSVLFPVNPEAWSQDS
jgi:lantibiotic modifying enzyme